MNRSSDADFQREIGEFLDVEEFLRFIAANALLVNLDSYLGGRHNYYLYLDPRDNRFRFIPWDQDLSLASFGGGRGGASGNLLDLSLLRPARGRNVLLTRLLALPEHEQRYNAILEEIVGTVFNRESLHAIVDRIEAAIGEAMVDESEASRLRGEWMAYQGFGRGPDPRDFIDSRTWYVNQQLSGKSRGTVQALGGPGRF